MMVFRIPPRKNTYITSLLSLIETFDSTLFESGPTQFLIPQSFEENYLDLKTTIQSFTCKTKVFYAHKANKSRVFVRKAKELDMCIDVASLQELSHAIEEGFIGEQIVCTGIKNEVFLRKAVEYNCLLVIDSLLELELLRKDSSLKKPSVLIRISDPFPENGSYFRTTRFGISQKEYSLLLENNQLSHVDVKGLHLHFDEYMVEHKSLMITQLLSLYTKLYQHKCFPVYINIGGGYRYPLVDENQKDEILKSLEFLTFEDISFSKTICGIEKGRNGGLSKTLLSNKLFPLSGKDFLSEILGYNKDVEVMLNELSLNLLIEPGNLLLDQCGVIVMRVLGTKKINSSNDAVIVDGNMYNLSSHMKPWVTDPILMSRDNTSSESFHGFILGNLCKEDDILMDRKVFFKSTPKNGDLLIFCNTAGYSGSFEDTDAILQPKLKNFVFTINDDGENVIQTESEYLGGEK